MPLSTGEIAALAGVGSGLLVPVGQMLLGFWRGRRETRLGEMRVAVDCTRLEVEEREAMARTLLQTVESLRQDIARLRGELDAERKLRMEAEGEVRALRVEIEALRIELRSKGVTPGTAGGLGQFPTVVSPGAI